MSVGSVLLARLRRLATSIDHDDTLGAALNALATHLEAAVASYCGLQLIMAYPDWPVILTEFTAGSPPPATVVRVPLTSLVPAVPAGSRVLFFATVPGALIDLAADLSYVLDLPLSTGRVSPGDPSTVGESQQPAIQLDHDLPAPSMASGIAGVEELSTINRALGLLMDRGHLPEDARHTLRSGATAAGLEIPAYAARLLAR